jgi:hypothetical protein
LPQVSNGDRNFEQCLFRFQLLLARGLTIQWRMAMEKRNSLVKKPSALLAAALVLISTGIASAATRQHELSSTNVQDAVGPAGYAAPHEVPENGGAASMVQPGSIPTWR